MFCDDGNILLTVPSDAMATIPVVLEWGKMCPPGNTWQNVETFLAVKNGQEGVTGV